MKNVSTKNRGVRALIVTGVAGAGLLMSGLTGTIAESRPLQTIINPCEYENCYTPNTRNTIPENQTSSTTTTEATTTTTETPRETTTTEGQETTTTAAPESTTTTAPADVAGAGAARPAAARPVAAQASYTG